MKHSKKILAPFEKHICDHPGPAFEMTLSMPYRAWRLANPILDGVQRLVRRRWPTVAYARKIEVDQGLPHAHYYFHGCVGRSILAMVLFLSPMVTRHLAECGVSMTKPIDVQRADAYWMDYLRKPGLQPGLHIPAPWMARYPLRVHLPRSVIARCYFECPIRTVGQSTHAHG
jgi:hypothetical protein